MSRPFAAYEPRGQDTARAEPPPDLSIDPMAATDIAAVAALRAARHGTSFREHEVWARSSIQRCVHAPERLFLVVARAGDATIAYGCATVLSPTESAPENAIPAGHYLGGLLVDPHLRRRGIGRRLTRARLDWIFERAETAYYFQNAINGASRDLHDAFGFREVRRGIWAPGVTFTGGVGVLYAARRPRA